MSKYLLNEADKKELVYILGFFIHDLESNSVSLENRIRLGAGKKEVEVNIMAWERKIDTQREYQKKLEELRDKVKDLEVKE